jgi:AcrR family transcriptional regulator
VNGANGPPEPSPARPSTAAARYAAGAGNSTRWVSDIAKRPRVVKPAARRREEILRAALGLFGEKGYDATTVQDIADAAEVAAGTVYLYFSSKEELLGALHQTFHERMRSHLEAVAAHLLGALAEGTMRSDEATDAWVDAIAGFMLDHRDETTVICRYLPELHAPLAETRQITDFVAGVIAAGVDAGRIHVSDPEMAAHLMVPMLREPFIQAIVYGEPPDMPRLVAQAKELFRKALAVG